MLAYKVKLTFVMNGAKAILYFRHLERKCKIRVNKMLEISRCNLSHISRVIIR